MSEDGSKNTGQTVRLSPRAGRGRIALAIRVRGSFRECGSDGFKHACNVCQHVVVPKSQDSIIVIGKPFVANGIARVVSVLPSIDLNDEATVSADKVDGVRTDRLLPNELIAVQPAQPEPIPERSFRIRRSSPQTPSTLGLVVIGRARAETPPHPARFARRPLPARGERLAPHAIQ